jgi:dTMP kinase
MTDRPRFITLEGLEGAGKSTNLTFIAEHLRGRGLDVLTTREPGGTALGESLRQVLLDSRSAGMTAEAELLLLFAARREHVVHVIRPALQQGWWVICDRFLDASYAYQGGGRGLPRSRIDALAEWLLEGLHPDLTFYLETPIALSQARITAEPDRFEQEHAAFFERVDRAYRERAAEEPNRIRRIDASESLEAIQHHLVAALDEHLDAR